MIEARASHPAFSPYAGQEIPEAPPGLFLTLRSCRRRKQGALPNECDGGSDFLLATRFRRFRVETHGRITEASSAGEVVRLPPYGVAWFAAG